ncbi:hypothetical protein FQR65_LT14900 [Abscondita terminalis]|nr:hypothetical protein FQR65_LT14900 [Abscondita terminalis]
MNFNTQFLQNLINWKKIEKNLKPIVVSLFGVCCILVVLLIAVVSIKPKKLILIKQDEVTEGPICVTPACVEMSSRILQNMDFNVNPCTDFYSFCCGNFMKNTYLAADEYVASSFQDVQAKVYQQIKSLLADSINSDELRPFALAKHYYRLCLNTSAIEIDGLSTIKSILTNLNGWPVVENQNWYDAKFDWKETMYALRKMGFQPNYILSVDVMIDPNNSSTRVISLDKPNFGIDVYNLVEGLNDTFTRSYLRYMIDIAEEFGANRTHAIEEMQQSLNFEINLAKISTEHSDGVLSYHSLTIGKLQHKYLGIDWKKYLKYLLDVPDFQITDDDVVIVRNSHYLDCLEQVIDSTSKRTQANYIIWRAIHSIIPYLNNNLRNRRLLFKKEIFGEEQLLPQWKKCTLEVMENLWESITNAYLRKHAHQQTKELVSEMLSNIGNMFINVIEKADWMDNQTKLEAYDKAKGMPYFTIFSDEMQDEALVKFYSSLTINSTNYLQSVLSVWSFRSNNHFKNIREPVTKKDRAWDISMMYQMGVPQGLFQGLFYHKDRPNYTNYGTIGSIIGHLLTHVYDEYGRQYNKNLEAHDWWTNYTKIGYKNISQCIIDHYRNYTVPELSINLNSKQTVHEDIADITGLKVAYLTYQNWSKNNEVESRLPGINFTQNQMFWISAANMWCTKYRIQYLTYILLLEPFTPSNYRITAALRNIPYFSEDFNCSSDYYMNSIEKCKIW